MNKSFSRFESVVRATSTLTPNEPPGSSTHPFDERNIHSDIGAVSIELFDSGHYSQATFEAFKLLDIKVKELSHVDDFGFGLMMAAFNEKNPIIRLNPLANASDMDEQRGYKHIFAGVMAAIRNPRGHNINVDTIGRCLDHLSLASVLMRRLDQYFLERK